MDKWYQERFYRSLSAPEGLVGQRAKIRESDILAFTDRDMQDILYCSMAEARRLLERYIEKDAKFAKSFEPCAPVDNAPAIARRMAESASFWQVGPMASVAGAIAEHVGRELNKHSQSVIVENGGDAFVSLARKTVFRLYAGEDSPFTDKIAFEIPESQNGLGVCTSSSTVGHSISLGKADAAVAIADSATEADAAATALCNKVKSPGDVDRTIEYAASTGRLRGVIIAAGDKIGFWGEIKILEEGEVK